MKKQSLALAILLVLALVSLHAAPQSQGDQAKSSIQSAGTATKNAANSPWCK